MNYTGIATEELLTKVKELAVIKDSCINHGIGMVDFYMIPEYLALAERYDLHRFLCGKEVLNHPESVLGINTQLWHYTNNNHIILTFSVKLLCKRHAAYRELHAQALISGEKVILHLGDFSLDREEATAQQVKGLVELLQFSDMLYMQKIVK